VQDSIPLLESEYQKIPIFSFGGGEVSFAESIDQLLPQHSAEGIPRAVRKGWKTSATWGFVYTSGTTGLPKAAIIQHLRFMSALVFASAYGITGEDRLYLALPLYHSAAGIIGTGIMVFTGCTIFLRRKFSASQFMSDIRENDCTVFQYIGELCRYLLNSPVKPDENKHKLKIAFGNGLRPDIWENFQTRFNIPYIGEFYAATEGNAPVMGLVGLDGVGRGTIGRIGTLARRIFGHKIVKFDVDTETPIRGPDGFCIECKPGEPGELLGLIDAKDPTKEFVGYHGNKAGNEKKVLKNAFKKGDMYFRTGDLIKRDEFGYYYFVDRIGDTFRWKGENVATTEVAEVLSTIPGIKEANVYGVKVEGADGRAGMAAIVAEENLDFARVAQVLSKELPSYAIPLFLRIMPEIEITGTFKHRKVEMRDQGYNPSTITDKLYYLNTAKKIYEPLTPAIYQQLNSGKSRL